MWLRLMNRLNVSLGLFCGRRFLAIRREVGIAGTILGSLLVLARLICLDTGLFGGLLIPIGHGCRLRSLCRSSSASSFGLFGGTLLFGLARGGLLRCALNCRSLFGGTLLGLLVKRGSLRGRLGQRASGRAR